MYLECISVLLSCFCGSKGDCGASKAISVNQLYSSVPDAKYWDCVMNWFRMIGLKDRLRVEAVKCMWGSCFNMVKDRCWFSLSSLHSFHSWAFSSCSLGRGALRLETTGAPQYWCRKFPVCSSRLNQWFLNVFTSRTPNLTQIRPGPPPQSDKICAFGVLLLKVYETHYQHSHT